MKPEEKQASWQPESDLDRALIAAGRAFYGTTDVRWCVSAHAMDRWVSRFGGGTVGAYTNNPQADLNNPKLRLATHKEVDKIRASCRGHAGDASRGTHYFILPDPNAGIRDRVFVCVAMTPDHRHWSPRAGDQQFVVITVFQYLRTAGAALARSGGRQKQLRLKR